MKGDKARFESTFATDIQIANSNQHLKNKKTYDKLLGMKGK